MAAKLREVLSASRSVSGDFGLSTGEKPVNRDPGSSAPVTLSRTSGSDCRFQPSAPGARIARRGLLLLLAGMPLAACGKKGALQPPPSPAAEEQPADEGSEP
jgi:predicted small lipoprotein YifL